MILVNYSWEELIDNRQKKLAFFGAGNMMKYFLKNHKNWESRLSFIIDNDSLKWDTSIVISGKMIPIISLEKFCKCEVEEYIIVISTLATIQVYEQLENLECLKNTECAALCFVKELERISSDNISIKYPSSFRLNEEQLIPKKIHYCWFGGKKIPEKNKKWMESWKKYCPNYEIIEWNESNYDIGKNKFMKQAYESGKWGFVPDYARLDIIYEYGGIYLDTDVELIKPLDELLYQYGFAGVDDSRRISLGLGFGAVMHNKTIGEMRKLYENKEFDPNNMVSAPDMMREYFLKCGFKMNGEYQELEDITIYPEKVLSAKSNYTGLIKPTKYTFSIHHYDGSWQDEEKMKPIHAMHELYARMVNP